MQTAIKELQTEVETTNQDSIRHERDSDQLTTSVGEITRVVESSETAIAESNEQVASLHEIFEGMLERADATEQTYTRAKLQQEDLGTAKEKMLAQQEIKTRQVQQLGKTVSDLQSRMHDLTLQLSEESSIVDQNRSENRALKETYRKLEKLVARSNRKLLSEDTDGSRLTEVSGNTTRSTSSDWWPSGSTASLGGSDHVGSFSRTVAAHSPGASVELDDEMCMTMSPSNGVQHSVTSPDKHPGGAATSDVESESSDADAEPEPKSTSPNTATASALSASNVHTSSAKSISPTSNDGTAGGTKIRWKLGDEKLGEGAFAQVYMGLELDTGHIIAVKELKVRFDCEPAKEHLQALEKEIGVMRNLHHPNIVRYIGTERSNSRLFILLEYVSGGSISTMLKRFGALGEDTVRVYCRHILEGLGYLHDRHIVHRDIKGANLLVGEDGFVKLADFGCSIQLESLTSLSMNEGTKLEASGHTKAFVMNGSVPWMAPEVMKQENPGQKADIWSLGCTVVEMLTGHRPWPAYKTHMSLILKLMTKPGRPPLTGMKATLSATADAFLGSCFQVDPRVRWTAKQLSHHAYVSGGVRA